jgi:hypothetical protein
MLAQELINELENEENLEKLRQIKLKEKEDYEIVLQEFQIAFQQEIEGRLSPTCAQALIDEA